MTPSASGIYVAQPLSNEYVPVTRDRRYVETCARVNRDNVKIGKAKNLATRERNYWKDFDQENIEFIPIALLESIREAETAILRELKAYRKRSPKGGSMNCLQGRKCPDPIKYQAFKKECGKSLAT